jgi:DNA-binding beta-propeller fold protein YncE
MKGERTMLQQWIKRAVVGGAMAGLLSLALPLAASADFGIGYTIDPEPGIGRDPAPVSYVYDHEITLLASLQDSPAPSMKNPSDMFLDPTNQHLWIADTDNNRLIELDQNDTFLRIVGQTAANAPKTQATLNGPQGLFVAPDGTIYVADSGNSRIAVFDKTGKFLRAYGKPETELLKTDASYKPTKVVVDPSGRIYVVNGGGDFRGVILMDATGTFRGFFGANHNLFSLTSMFTRLFATAEQKAQIAKTLPSSDTNMYLSGDGYLYTVSATAQMGQIKKLNSLGKDVYKVTNHSHLFGLTTDSTQAFFGEKPIGNQQFPQFVSITVDNTGIISALDAGSGKIYQYDQNGNMLDIFGGKQNSQNGYFDYPAALAIRPNGNIYVLDSSRKDIQVFRPTQFATMIHEASVLFYDGKYQASATIWQQLLKMDAHYSLAHDLLGQCYLNIGQYGGTTQDYVQAMQQEQLAEDRTNYSAAFAQYRHDWAEQNFGLMLGIVAGAIVVVVVVARPIGRLVEAAMKMG